MRYCCILTVFMKLDNRAFSNQFVASCHTVHDNKIKEAVRQLVNERVRNLRHEFCSECPTHHFQELVVQFSTFEIINVTAL